MASPMVRKVSPRLMLPAYKMYSPSEEKVVDIHIKHVEEEDEVKVVGSSHGWLGLLKEEARRRSVSLWNPMSGSRIKLPPLNILPLEPYHYMSVRNLIVDDEECGRAIWPCVDFLALCCPGRCTEWTMFGSHRWYSELLYSRHHKLLFCLEQSYSMESTDLEGWDVSDPRRPRLECTINLWDVGWEDPRAYRREWNLLYDLMQMHLVSSPVDGDCSLFLVSRHPDVVREKNTHGSAGIDDYHNISIAFDVRRMRIHTRELSYMEGSLDGLVMFVGDNHSFAVSAADYPHLKPDSIYFAYGEHDTGIYDYRNGTFSPCYYPTLHQSLKWNQPPPFWFTPTSKS